MTSTGRSQHEANDPAPQDGARDYASTRWTLLLASGVEARRSWEHFYERYRAAVAALYHRKGVPPDEVDTDSRFIGIRLWWAF